VVRDAKPFIGNYDKSIVNEDVVESLMDLHIERFFERHPEALDDTDWHFGNYVFLKYDEDGYPSGEYRLRKDVPLFDRYFCSYYSTFYMQKEDDGYGNYPVYFKTCMRTALDRELVRRVTEKMFFDAQGELELEIVVRRKLPDMAVREYLDGTGKSVQEDTNSDLY
jgi:hypothetical protein